MNRVRRARCAGGGVAVLVFRLVRGGVSIRIAVRVLGVVGGGASRDGDQLCELNDAMLCYAMEVAVRLNKPR